MVEGFREFSEICECFKYVCFDDKSLDFNIQCIECFELDNFMEIVYSIVVVVNFRMESCGVYSCFDFLDCDDENWLCYSIYDLNIDKMFICDVNMVFKFREVFLFKVCLY